MNPTEPLPVLPGDKQRVFRLPEWGLALLCLFLFFWRLGSVPLFDLDEALYVTCARQMAQSGDMVTPRLNSRPLLHPKQKVVPFFEKPILVYWVCAASLRLFGMSEGAARLPVALAALLTTGLVAYAGTRWFGRRAGLLAGVVYATAPMTLIDARQMTTDGLLVLWFSIALFAFYEILSRHSEAGKSLIHALLPRRYSRIPALLFAIFWGACALAVLTKGAVGLLLPALVIGTYLAFSQVSAVAQWGGGQGLLVSANGRLRGIAEGLSRLRLLRPLWGLLLVGLVIAPWHLAIARTHERDAEGRTWVQEYIVRQHIGRFKGLDTVHNAPLPTYFVYFLVGFFPWACFAPVAFRRINTPSLAPAAPLPGHKQAAFSLESLSPDEADAPNAVAPDLPPASAQDFLLVWFWTIFVFFTIGAAKLPTYIVPCYPAAALLTGLWLDRLIREGRRGAVGGALAAALTAGILVVGTIAAPYLVPKDRPIPPEMIKTLLHITMLLLAGCGAAWACFRWKGYSPQGRMAGVGLLAAAMTGLIAVGTTEGYAVASKFVLGPYQHSAAAASADAASGIPVLFYHIIPRRPSMLYYGGYSPLERKEEPLLPYLRAQMQGSVAQVDVVTAGDVYAGEIQGELAKAPDLRASELFQEGTERGGWVLLRFQKR